MMRKLNAKELREYQIRILEVTAAFCEERGINYWLDFGTLICAVRHKGFIPWDDDIDIAMLRPDFDRFMKEFNGCNSRFEAHCIENDPNYVRPFGRVFDTHTSIVQEGWEHLSYYGICIDVFVHDNAPDDDKAVASMFARRDFLCMLNFARLKRVFGKAKGNIFRRLCVYAVRILLHVLPIGFFSRLLAKNSKRYASKVTKRVGNFSGYSKAVCDREAFTSLIDVEFEGKTYKAPAGYDRWLRTVYGDYMQFPPLEERVGHNFIAAYLKDDSK